jgi:hypothetical protein
MDNLESPIPAQPDTPDLQAQFDSLRQLVVSVLVLLIVISGTFTIYLLRQYRSTNADLALVEPQVKAEMSQYTRAKAVMDEFVQKIGEYGRSHPDFAPVLSKYGINKNVSPAPVSAPAPKK